GRGSDVETIVHMGAVSSTTEPDADKIIHSNFTLSRDLFDWSAEHNRRMIYASSAATYGDGSLGFEDDDSLEALEQLRPLNAYGWSKALFDVYAARKAARGQAPPQWTGLKFFNVYGPNEGHKGGMKSVVAQVWPTVRDGGQVQLFQSHNPSYADGGQMRLRLFDDEAPTTVNNFVYLANQGFYDGTTFHRVLENFMAQGGDPSGTGSGGPGYTFQDETDNGLTFDRRGLLAMANSGPDTNGSQFFITFAPATHLDGLHTIFGELTEGDDVLSGITLRDPDTATAPGDVIEEITIFEQ
ncbi:MAG TPA: peptidylprolyl isomerase, partial [Promineifilum sp.]|nr:peptidylprolyl isomerase [Promineifilum sp.]